MNDQEPEEEPTVRKVWFFTPSMWKLIETYRFEQHHHHEVEAARALLDDSLTRYFKGRLHGVPRKLVREKRSP